MTNQAKKNKPHSEAKSKILALIQKDNDVSLTDIMHFAESMAHSMDSYFGSIDKAIYREFCEIGEAIANMRMEIGQLQANDIKNAHIPGAGEELAAIISTTEDATDTIMSSAEAIMEADAADSEAYQASVFDNVMKIMEACSFQDLTGQRISKVVETLEYIEDRISRSADAIGERDGTAQLSEEEIAREKRRKELLLNGPQAKEEAIAQSVVDDMFGAADQSGIDALFD